METNTEVVWSAFTSNDTQIDIDWEYLGVDKAWLRKMEKDWLTPKNYHLRIGAYPTN